MLRFASSIALQGGRGTAFPVYAAQVPGCSIWSMPSVVYGSSFPVLHKKHRLGCACILCLPWPEQHRQPGPSQAHFPRVRCAFSPPWPQPQFSPPLVRCVPLEFSCDPPRGCQPYRISGSLWLETGGLFAVCRGCHLWGRVCPFPLPPASCLQWGWAGPQLLWTCSVPLFCERLAVFGPVNFLSLSCYPTV